MSHKTNEPFWWGLFAAGGMIAAMLAPVMILVTAFILPLGGAHESLSYANASALLDSLIVKLGLAGIVTLSLFHCAHRIRHTFVDVGIAKPEGIVAAICYFGAAAASVACGWALA